MPKELSDFNLFFGLLTVAFTGLFLLSKCHKDRTYQECVSMSERPDYCLLIYKGVK